MKKSKRVLWVIGGGSLQIPIIEEAKKLGLATLVTDMSSKCVAKAHADYFYPVDIFDVAGNVDLLFRLKHFDGLDIVGVLAAGIDANITAAVLARIAGLPGVDPQAAPVCPRPRRLVTGAGRVRRAGRPLLPLRAHLSHRNAGRPQHRPA